MRNDPRTERHCCGTDNPDNPQDPAMYSADRCRWHGRRLRGDIRQSHRV